MKMYLKIKQIVTIFFAVLFFPSLSWPAQYFVATNGDDANPGTAAKPWKTVQKAADAMVAGDRVTVQEGVYNEAVTIKTSGEAGLPIVFKASGTARVLSFTVNANYIVIDSFNISNGFSETWTANGILVLGAYNVIERNIIHDLRYQGIRVGSENDDQAIHNNIIRHNTITKAAQCGINVAGRNNLVEHNEINTIVQHPTRGKVVSDGADADGIRFFGSGHVIRGNKIDLSCSDSGNINPHIDCFQTWGPAYNIVVEQNICMNPDAYTSGGCQPHAWFIEEDNAPVNDLTFKNNVIWAQVGGLFVDTERASVLNNTFKGRVITNGPWSVGVQLSNSPGAKIHNNIFFDIGNNEHAYIDVDNASRAGTNVGYNCHFMSNGQPPEGDPYPHDIWQQDPQLVNAAGDDLSLRATSPLIDKGVPLKEMVNDFRNVGRPFGTGYDIGAYEFSNSGLLPPPAPTGLSVKFR